MTVELDATLKALNIIVEKFEHEGLKTCFDADRLGVERTGCRLKNLFLRDNYGKKHFLLLAAHNKQVDLKKLSNQLNVSKLGFGSKSRLKTYLGVEPGHLSALALINDTNNNVRLLVDKGLWTENSFQCHPLNNQKTYVLTRFDMAKYLNYTRHKAEVISVPYL